MPESAEALVRWIFERMRVPNISVVNHAHVDAAVFLVDGVEPSGRYQWGKELGVAPAYGGRWTATEEVYLGNWYVCQPKHTLGDEIGLGSRLGEVFVNRAEEPHELVLTGRCVDKSGSCDGLLKEGQCYSSASTMAYLCARTCGFCVHWDWLFELGLGVLYDALLCWQYLEPSPNDAEFGNETSAAIYSAMLAEEGVPPHPYHCIRNRRTSMAAYPTAGRPLRSRLDLIKLASERPDVVAWLRTIAVGPAVVHLEAALATPAVPVDVKEEL